ncbi:meiosis protein SPO22/ZIP4 like-domain-containing protein [Aspergillus floccosus]
MLEAARRTEVSENGVLDTSHRIIEIVAMELDTLKSSACPDHDQTQSLEIQYYMIRIHLAWCQGRADIADHLYSQVPRVTQKGNQFTIMEMAYKIGGLALSSHQYDTAVKWSQRALNACEAWTEGGQKRGQPSDQRMLILHQNGESVLRGLRQRKLTNSVLYSAIGTMDLASSTVNVPRALLGGLKRLLTERLLLSCNRELTETAVVSFIWSLTVSVDCSAGVLDILNEGMKLLESAKLGTISETATEACLLAIWKHVDKEISRTNYLVAGNWCHFVLEQVIFLIASDNKEKLMRSVFHENTNSNATVYLDLLFNQVEGGCSYLVACTFDALKHGDIWLAAKCLEMTMSTYYNSRSEGAEVAKLLRYVLCSLAERLNSLQGEELLLNQILKIIETALVPGVCDEQMTLLSHLGPSFIVKKAHSIALKALKSSLLDFAVRCLDLSIRVSTSRRPNANPYPDAASSLK